MKMSISEMIKEYISKHKDDVEKIEVLASGIEEFFDESEEKDSFWHKIYDVTDEITEDMIISAANTFKRKDGTHSDIKWTIEETDSVCRQYDVKSKVEMYGKKYDHYKFWFAMNYVYAVHFNINRTLNGYVDLAIEELVNHNVCFDKLIREIYDNIR